MQSPFVVYLRGAGAGAGAASRAASDPVLPIAVLALALAAAVGLASGWLFWAALAGLAGYSLSGST